MRIRTVDCQYLQPRFAAAYLLHEQGEAAFVDNNTAHSVPLLLAALAEEGLDRERVRYVIVTHVHLDHAGGTSELMKACPQARLLAHPRALPHLLDPTRLVASARLVYGEDVFTRLYGTLSAIDGSRAQAMEDGSEIRLAGGSRLRFLHTRGHANHHFCVEAPEASAIFTGDAFGVCYPDLQKPGRGRFIFPSTSPTDFDGPMAIQSVERIVNTGAQTAYPTHFGPVTDLPEAAAQLKLHLEFSIRLVQQLVNSGQDQAERLALAEREMYAHYREYLSARALPFDNADWALMKLDLDLNAAGIAHVASKILNPPHREKAPQ